uniref:Histone deacetylase domain-containing protein n=1 Tax=Panagrolaimus davidi TaxID=227884 RepID=A0A914R155_9BILA
MTKTFFITDSFLLKHQCEWTNSHVETPERLGKIIEKLESCGILDQCERLESRDADEKEIQLVHSKKYYETIKESTKMNLAELENLCTQIEDSFLNQYTFDVSVKAVGCALKLMENILSNSGSNGFAAIRPPGHHANPINGCGFCIFNNVAICAKKARQMGLKKVLIIDWDVHAGQGTQYCIENDSGIFLISIHRYESGNKWPNLPESNIKSNYKQTLNVPLQKIGLGDAEYAAFIDLIVRPIIADYKPELILVSCGFDAGFGDCEGEMNVTPAGFGHLTGTLASLNIPLVLLLEGGYFVNALPEHAFHTIKALIERTPTALPLGFPSLEDMIPFTGKPKYTLPYTTRGAYETMPDVNKFDDIFFKQLLPRYSNPPIRSTLDFTTQESTIVISCNGNTLIKFTPSKNNKDEEIMFIYHFVYLPLTWQYKVDWKILKELILKTEGKNEAKLEVEKCSNLINSVLLEIS